MNRLQVLLVLIFSTALSHAQGTNVSVNGGSTLPSANLNGTTPGPGAGNRNVTWQVDGSGNVSAEFPDTTDASNITSGTLNGARLPATAVQTNQPNTYTAGKQQVFTDSSTTAGIGHLGLAGDPSSPIFGDEAFNTSINRYRFYDGTQQQSNILAGDLDQLGQSFMTYLLGQNSTIELRSTQFLQNKLNIIACIGDSHTAGYPNDNSWCMAMTRYLQRLYGNAGSGWCAADAAATPSFAGSNGATPHDPAPVGCSATVTNAAHWTEEYNGTGKSSGSPDDTDINDSTSGDTLIFTAQTVTQFVLYYPTCTSGCGSFTYSVDSNPPQGTISENTGTGWTTLSVTTLDGTNLIPEGRHTLNLTMTTASPTYFFGVDPQDNVVGAANNTSGYGGYGIRIHKLASNSESANQRNANSNFAAQLWNATNCHSLTPASSNLCINSAYVMYSANERNQGITIATAQGYWDMLEAIIAGANPQLDQTWLSEPDNAQTCTGGCKGTMGQFSAGMRDRTQAWSAASSTQPVGFYNVWQLFPNYSQASSRFLLSPDNVHLLDTGKNLLGELVAAAVIKGPPRVRSRTPLDSGPATVTATNSLAGFPVLYALAKISTAGGFSVAGTSDTAIPLYPCIYNCSAGGSGEFAVAGIGPVYMDGVATVGHYVTASTTIAGYGHDSGYSSTSPPALTEALFSV